MNKRTPLLIIDVQNAFDDSSWGKRNNGDAEKNIAGLLQLWRRSGWPVIHVAHVSDHPQSLFYRNRDSSKIKDLVLPLPDEIVIEKSVNSAFIGTDLESILHELVCERLFICGLTTNHCVETTVRMAGNLGFNPVLVSDAAAAFDRTGPDGKRYKAEEIHQMTLANLHGEFAETMTAEEVMDLEGRLKRWDLK
ncbi:isochorismatase family protein [Bacillus mangrovi]|uniref:Isochorismatase family protein n=1 Tax=Metabacillus mangrovi TaxID=1491830 RepID=A0A7X2S5Y5_9BACI|nr:cysteine hydrolase family protein [Metabacillus mangrovi]MTH54259.1 isochorismatase family protein [Metabacillus mangrovi]